MDCLKVGEASQQEDEGMDIQLSFLGKAVMGVRKKTSSSKDLPWQLSSY